MGNLYFKGGNMQISQINNADTNFKALKGIYTEGIYKKYPKQAGNVLKELKANKKVMDFCQRYETEVHLSGTASSYSGYDTKLRVTYKPLPSKNKFKNFMQSIAKIFKTEKAINCVGFGLCMDEASDHLIKGINENGTLNKQIMNIENDVKDKAMTKAVKMKKRETAKLIKQTAKENKKM